MTSHLVGATLFEGERASSLQHPALDGAVEKRESHCCTMTGPVLGMKC
jgi:hypothetical protein